MLGAVAGCLGGHFDVLDELESDVKVEQRGVPAIEFASFVPLAGHHEIPQFLVLVGERQTDASDPAFGAEEGALEGEVIDAGEDGEPVAHVVDDIGDASNVAGGFFDGDEVVAFVAEDLEQLGREVDVVGDGIVVDEDRQSGVVGYASVVGQGLVSVGFVDHGGHQHDAIDAHGFALLGVFDGFGGGTFGDAAEDLDFTVGNLLGELEDFELLFPGEGQIFAQRPVHDKARYTGVEQDFEVLLEGDVVDGEVLVEWRCYGGKHA